MDKKKSSYRVQSEATTQTSSKKGKRKEKTKSTSKEVQTVTDQTTGQVSTTKTTSVEKSKTGRGGNTKSKSKLKEDFQVTDSEGNVLLRDKTRITSRNGKTKINRRPAQITSNYRKKKL